MTIHPIPPVWNGQSRVLILGSFPSVRSREEGFFYGHPQNRFWRVLAALWDENVPLSREDKIRFLHAHTIALWDAVAACEVEGSADSTIRAVVPNDITPILYGAPIGCVITNGAVAASLYGKHIAPGVGSLRHIPLPSTSAANAAWSLDRLCDAWRVLRAETERTAASDVPKTV